MGVVNIYGNAKLSFQLALDEGSRTRIGLQIKTFLNASDREYDVVLLDRGETYGQMLTDGDAPSPEAVKARGVYEQFTGSETIARPTVLWCPNYEFESYGDVSGVRIQSDGSLFAKSVQDLQPGDYYYQYPGFGGRPTKVAVVRYTTGLLLAWIVLFHELGHVKQYYQPAVNNATNSGRLKNLWNARLADTDAIEAENLEDHEKPMCREVGVVVRMHYKHMGNGMYRIAEAYGPKTKAPALRVANSSAERTRQDAELASSLQRDIDATGFFRR